MKRFEIPMVVTSLVGLCFLAGLEAPPARADFVFGNPVNLGPTVNDEWDQYGAGVSADGLEFYFYMGGAPTNYGICDLYVTTRQTPDDAWGPPENLGPIVNDGSWNESPCLSQDGLSLYFGSDRPNGYGSWDLYVTTRPTKKDPWGPPVNLGPNVNSSYCECVPRISADGLSLFFSETDVDVSAFRPGGCGGTDLWVSTRPSTQDEWGVPVNLEPPVNTGAYETCPWVSDDGLSLLFARGDRQLADIMLTRRKTKADPWETPVNVGPPVNSATVWEGFPCISRDGSTLYFVSYRHGGYGYADLWQAPIIPIVDFNGSGIVDTSDLVRLIESWGQADSCCDIGRFAWGDGVVDEADLEVLMRYWGQPVDDPTLIAHWALDETEGSIAAEHVAGHNGVAVGAPLWQREDGHIDGALELDGATFLKAPFVLNPSEGPFSVLAWIKEGGPGQTILSQQGAANWLAADAAGALMTDLSTGGRKAVGLWSEAVITDGNWHRIALTWDGANRRLYVDGALVAEDAQGGVAASYTDLLLGAGKTAAPGTFWTGLIDDVRIYNRAVQP
jgi:hypothetical protein